MNDAEPIVETQATAQPVCSGEPVVSFSASDADRSSSRDSIVDRRSFANSVWRRKSAGSVFASLLLHLGAIASALAYTVHRQPLKWELRLSSGKNSISLSASVASPQSEAAVPMKITLPETTAIEQPPERREAELPDRPAALFASAAQDVQRPLPRDARPSTSGERLPERKEPESPRPKRSAAVRLPEREMVQRIESPNSAPSAASTGAEVRRSPKELVRVEPAYPAAALAAKQQGIVRLRVKVNARGEVVEADVHQSCGYPLLDQAALDVIYRWQFSSPTEADGVAAEFVQPIQFRIAQ